MVLVVGFFHDFLVLVMNNFHAAKKRKKHGKWRKLRVAELLSIFFAIASPFFTLAPPDFFTPPFARRPDHRLRPVLFVHLGACHHFAPCKGAETGSCRQGRRPPPAAGMPRYRHPRHADRKIEPDGMFAAEEGGEAFKWHDEGKGKRHLKNYQIGLLGYHNDEDKKIPRPFDGGFSILID